MIDITTINSAESVQETLKTEKLGGEIAKIIVQNFLNKPGMTLKDKISMGRSVKSLRDNDMDTSKNLQKLYDVIKGDYIGIGGVKRAKKDLEVRPNGTTVFQHGTATHIMPSEYMIKEINERLADYKMEIPSKDHFAESLKALPGDFSENNMYVGGDILSILLDAKMSGIHNSKGKLFYENKLGFLMSSTGIFNDSLHGYGFSANKGKLYRDNRDGAIPIRPVYK